MHLLGTRAFKKIAHTFARSYMAMGAQLSESRRILRQPNIFVLSKHCFLFCSLQRICCRNLHHQLGRRVFTLPKDQQRRYNTRRERHAITENTQNPRPSSQPESCDPIHWEAVRFISSVCKNRVLI